MFIICVVLYFFGGVIYVLFCDATTQSWALTNKEANTDEQNTTNKEQKDLSKTGVENLAFDLTFTTKF